MNPVTYWDSTGAFCTIPWDSARDWASRWAPHVCCLQDPVSRRVVLTTDDRLYTATVPLTGLNDCR